MFLTPTPTPTTFDQVAEASNRDFAMRATLTPAGRFNLIIDRAMQNVADKVVWGSVPIPIIRLVWRRLRNLRARFNSILARFQAGTLPAPGTTAPRPTTPPKPAAPSPPSDKPRLPARSGWLIHTISWFVNRRRYELQEMLDDPQTKTQLTETPQLGSALRPMCTMLAVKPPRWLRLPRRPRASRRKVVPPPPDEVLNMPGAFTKPDGTVWARFGASTKWTKPGLLWATLEEAQKFDYPVQIWPRD